MNEYQWFSVIASIAVSIYGIKTFVRVLYFIWSCTFGDLKPEKTQYIIKLERVK